MPCHFHDTFPTPAGPFSAAVDSAGALVATAFGDATALPSRFADKTALAKSPLTRSPAKLAAVRKQIDEYFAGARRAFTLPLAPAGGTPHQRRVWTALSEIPCGETRAYGEIAKKIGSSPRAIGRANATNPISLIVPCHRVIGADGSLTGYAFGEETKRLLLAHEGVRMSQARG
jgi:methylated-DNA-[protein]-cysteine S-methyltransferase